MQIDLSRRPSADAAIDSRPYWDGIAAGRFLIQQCAGCGLHRHYPRPMCGACHSMEHRWVTAGGRATVRSWTVCHHAFLPAFEDSLPYVLALAELEEGVRVNLMLVGVALDQLRMGLPVRTRIAQGSDGTRFPVLEADEAAAAAVPG
jgi:uncharacterized OB-fold protein